MIELLARRQTDPALKEKSVKKRLAKQFQSRQKLKVSKT